MGLDLASVWSSPRRWKAILLTMFGLTMLLAVPLYQLGDVQSPKSSKYSYKSVYDHFSSEKTADDTGIIDAPETNTNITDGTNRETNPDAPSQAATLSQGEKPGQTDWAAFPDDDDEEDERKDESDANKSQPEVIPDCKDFPNTDGIILVMKTGASESFEKLPAHFLTYMQCLPDYLLFSDLDQQIGKYKIHDVLGTVKDKIKEGKKEFNLYESQSKCPISQKDCSPEGKAWDLDKYKFLHMVERAWEMRPDKEWYVFAEADSYIFWPNLVTWLREKANASAHPYVGSVAMLKGVPFAHGGSGYVISGELMKKMVAIPDLADKYDERATHECCGDYLMSLAVMEAGSKVKNLHPMFNGEKPNTLPYGNGHWCEPLLTMHHVNSEELSTVWRYEKTRKAQGPVQIKELYHEFFAPSLNERRDDWDNQSDDICYIGAEPEAQSQASDHQKSRQKKENEKNAVERRAHFSIESCSMVCESEGLGIEGDDWDHLDSDEDRKKHIQTKWEERSKGDEAFNQGRRCFQWRYHKGACCIARSFKQGKPRRETDEKEKWTSGWFVNGINKWIEAKGECEVAWKDPR